jgi:copper transport protein
MKVSFILSLATLLALVTGLLTSAVWFSVPVVSAHANLVRSEPAANSVLDQPPDRVVIWFTEPIEAGFSEIQVLNSQGERVDKGDSTVDRSNPTIISVTLPSLPNGTYTVAWRNLSTVDGHSVRGAFVFSVGEPLSAAPPAAEAVEEPLIQSPLEPVFRWLVLLSALTIVGGLGIELLVTRPALMRSRSNQSFRLLGERLAALTVRLLWIAMGVLLLASLGQLMVQSSIVHGIPLHRTLGGPLVSILTETQWGSLWLWRVGLLLPLGVLVPLRGEHAGESTTRISRLAARLLALAMGAAILLTLSLSSHNAAVAEVRAAAIFSDYVHLLAAGFWVGGLCHLALGVPVILQTLSPSQRRAMLSTLIPRFSVVAILSVGTLMITGLYSGWVQVTIVEAVATPYGLTLLVKLGLVALLVFLGALNLLWVRPRLSREERASRWLQRLLVGEAVLAVLVLLSVGMLGSLEPARQMASRLGIGQEDRLTFQDRVEGIDITLKVAPGQVGPNQFTVSLKDRSGQPLTNVTEVRLDLTYLDSDLGTTSISASPTAPGEYVLEGHLLSLVGNWQAGLLVRRPDAFDTRTAFRFQVASPGATDSAAITPETNTGRLLWGVELALLGFLFIALGIPMGGWWRLRGAVVMGSGLASFIAGLFLAYNTQLAGTGATDNLINPFPPTADSLNTGQQLYAQSCQSCHGVAGRGDGPQAAGLNPPPLDLVTHVPLHSDGALFGFVQNGIPGTAMPAWGDKLTNEEIWHIVNYLRTFEEETQ